MKTIRRVHGWLGVLFAPSIIFFAVTGALQLFGFQDTPRGETPGFVAKLAMVHKDQTVEIPVRKPPPPAAAPKADAPKPDAPKPEAQPEHHSTMPLKLFFLLMALALTTSSVLGVWIAFASKRDQKLHIGLFIAGLVLPIVLLLV
jgi:hypothetical protein